jgi:CheY-like chemotaxis protein
MTQAFETTRIDLLVRRLRRYARAALGDRERADDCVVAALEAVLEATPPRPEARGLYGALYGELRRAAAGARPTGDRDGADGLARRVHELDEDTKHALLLRRLEGLDPGEAAAVMGLGEDEVERLLDEGLASLRCASHAAVLIIEDNAIVARHIEQVVAALGHDVTAVARTADEAVAAARRRRPDLVLADVELDGPLSGIDAIEAIRGDARLPAIFVTGFPERVARDELRTPDSLVSKPFDEGLLRAAMARALRAQDRPDAG